MSTARRALRGGTLILTAIAFAAALFAVGVPGLIDRSQTASLQESFSRGSVMDRVMVATHVFAPAGFANGTSFTATGMPDISDLNSQLQQFAQGAPASAHVQPAAAWNGESTATGLGGSSIDDWPAFMTLFFRPQLSSHAKLLTGSLPTTAGYEGGVLSLDVAMTPITAQEYGLHVGSTLNLTAVSPRDIRVRVTGLIAPTDESGSFWQYDPTTYVPAEYFPKGPWDPVYDTGAMIGPGELNALALIQGTQGANGVAAQYCVPLDTAAYTAGTAAQVINDLTSFSTGTTAASLNVTVTTGPLAILSPFQLSRQVVDGILAIVLAGVAAVGTVTLLMGARLVVDRRRAEYALLRARGQSLFQLAFRVTITQVPPALIAVATAAAAVRAYLPAADWTPTATELLIGVCVVCLIGPPAVAVFEHRRVRSGSPRADIVRRRRTTRSWVLEAVLVLCVAGAVTALRGQGIGDADGRGNALGSTVPILVAALATAIAAHFYPLVLRPAAHAAARRRGAGGFLGLAGASRSGATVIVPAFIVTLTLTLAAMGALMLDTVGAGRTSASWQNVGADADFRITWQNAAQSPPADWLAQLEKVRGVTHGTLVSQQPIHNPPNGAQDMTAFAIDPQSYAAVSADSPWPLDASLLAKPATAGSASNPGPAPVPVLASIGSGLTVGQTFTMQLGYAPSLQVKVVAEQGETPIDREGDFVLLPDWATASDPQDWLASTMLFSASPGLDENAMNSLVQKFAPGSTITFRDQYMDQLANAPLEHLARDGYLFGVIAAICFGLCAVLLSLALTSAARDRRLLLLTMLGLTAREARRIAWAETSPLAVTAALGGLVTAACLPAVIGSSLNLTAFTGLTAEGPMKLDPSVPLLAALGAVAFTALAVAVQAAAARRRRTASALRIGTGDEA